VLLGWLIRREGGRLALDRIIAMPGLGEWWRVQMTQRLEKQHEYWTETLKD
jgi:aryl carrier-like protein